MKKHGNILLLFMLAAINWASGQTVLLSIDRATDSIHSEVGPNMNRFTNLYFRAGMIAGPDKQGARIIYGPSTDFALGLRTKYKLGRVVSLGWEIEADEQIYKLKQENGKTVPDTFINKTERLQFFSLGLGYFIRINFDPRRGNYLGSYLDLGVCGEWDFDVRHIIKNYQPDGSTSKLLLQNLPYVTDLNSNVYFRLAHNKTAIYLSYRFTELFRPSYRFTELPKIILGLDLSLAP